MSYPLSRIFSNICLRKLSCDSELFALASAGPSHRAIPNDTRSIQRHGGSVKTFRKYLSKKLACAHTRCYPGRAQYSTALPPRQPIFLRRRVRLSSSWQPNPGDLTRGCGRALDLDARHIIVSFRIGVKRFEAMILHRSSGECRCVSNGEAPLCQ